MAIVNFADKEALYENPNIAEKNKITDANINLIKQVSQQTQKTIGVFTDDWTSGSTYNVGDIAIYDNRVFQNLTGTNTATTPDQDTTNWVETTIAAMAAGAASGDTLPIGSIVPYGSSTAPANWLVCDGSAVSRTTYADLFAVIGTSYGSGDGSTTFNLPNLKGKVPVGYNSSETEFDTMGETGGEKKHTLTIQEMPSHKHNINYAPPSSSGGQGNAYVYGTKEDDNNAMILATGGDQPHNNLQPYQVVCYIIKVGQSAGLVANVVNNYSTSQSDTYSCDYFNDCNTYSTSEINTGKTWVDGSTIYKKTYYFSALGDNSGVYQALDISNLSDIINMYGTASNGSVFFPLPCYRTDDTLGISMFIDNVNGITIATGNDRTSYHAYVTIEYIKTN